MHSRFEPTGDIIRDICKRFLTLDPNITQMLADRIEIEVRQAYVYERVLINSNVRNERRSKLALVTPDRPVIEQARELGLHRTTIWRHLKRKGDTST